MGTNENTSDIFTENMNTEIYNAHMKAFLVDKKEIETIPLE